MTPNDDETPAPAPQTEPPTPTPPTPTPPTPEPVVVRIKPVTEEEAARRRLLAEEAARRAGGKWARARDGRAGRAGRAGLDALPPAVVTVGSLLLFVVLGQFLWGWEHAVGITLLIFLHELGHVWAARRLGFPVTGLVFVPLLGAYVSTLRENGGDREANAFVALMGPVFGAAGGVLCAAVAFATRDDALFLNLAVWSFGLNLLNLIPFPPLDGGSIAPVLTAPVRRSRHDLRPGHLDPAAKRWLSGGYLGLAAVLAYLWYNLPNLAARFAGGG